MESEINQKLAKLLSSKGFDQEKARTTGRQVTSGVPRVQY